MTHYRNDPRPIIAKYSGMDAMGRRFSKGDAVTYYPASRKIYAGEAGVQAMRDFYAAKADEEMYSRA